jgi:hypothetical protein
MAHFYKVVLNGSYAGKDNLNTLYYRTLVDVGGGAFGFGGARELAEEVIQEIVPQWLDCKPPQYNLQTIDVYPRNSLFELLYQLPFKQEVNLAGTGDWTLGGQDSSALCLNFRFNLEPTVLGLQTFTAPKRGYIAVGPLPSLWLEDDGRLVSTQLNNVASNVRQLCDKLGQDLESIDPPAIFAPIRVAEHYGEVGGGFLGYGYADVDSVTVDEFASFRRSRRVRG